MPAFPRAPELFTPSPALRPPPRKKMAEFVKAHASLKAFHSTRGCPMQENSAQWQVITFVRATSGGHLALLLYADLCKTEEA